MVKVQNLQHQEDLVDEAKLVLTRKPKKAMHQQQQRPQRQRNPDYGMTCNYCGKQNHRWRKCFKFLADVENGTLKDGWTPKGLKRKGGNGGNGGYSHHQH